MVPGIEFQSEIIRAQAARQEMHAVEVSHGEPKEATTDKLHEARLKKGWSVEQVADRLGIGNADTVYRWESGQIPRDKNIRNLCELFGMSREELGF